MRNQILVGDVLERLRELPSESVHCVVTSPPYFGLRDYGTAEWEGGDAACGHVYADSLHIERAERTSTLEGSKATTGNRKEGHYGLLCGKCGARRIDSQLGLEATPEEYIANIVAVFREVRRVLRRDGTLWLNMGDGYAGSGKGPSALNPAQEMWNANVPLGLKPKDLVGMPWRLAFALQADGWWLRSDIIWSKPNPMPESVQGSHAFRHRITIDEYENLPSVRASKRSNEHGTADVSGLQARQVFGGEAALSAERERQGDGASAGGTSRDQGEAASVLSIRTGQGESGKICGDREGQGDGATWSPEISDERTWQAEGSRTASADEELAGAPATEDSGESSIHVDTEIQGEEVSGLRQAESRYRPSKDRHSGRLGRNSGETQAPLLLLQAQDGTDRGSRSAIEQGRDARERESGASLSDLQFDEEGSANPSLVDCPGCTKCNNGYILRLSAGRPTKAHEYVFLLTRSSKYFYNAEAVREPLQESSLERGYSYRDPEYVGAKMLAANSEVRAKFDWHGKRYIPAGRNKRSVWEIATQPFPEAHFATYPEELVLTCIKAGTSEWGCCSDCGAPWVRQTELTDDYAALLASGKAWRDDTGKPDSFTNRHPTDHPQNVPPKYKTIGWQPSCGHESERVPALILDCFMGSGTTALVALKAGRDFVGIELSESYSNMANRRIAPYLNRLL